MVGFFLLVVGSILPFLGIMYFFYPSASRLISAAMIIAGLPALGFWLYDFISDQRKWQARMADWERKYGHARPTPAPAMPWPHDPDPTEYLGM